MLDLNNVTSGYSTNVINSNFRAIQNYINDNLLSRDGVSPGQGNQMNVPLDMNGQPILNLGGLSGGLVEKIAQLEQRIQQLEGE